MGEERRPETLRGSAHPRLTPYICRRVFRSRYDSDDTSKEVIRLATTEQLEKAITAVANGTADAEQQRLATAASKQAGERGNRAKEAFKS